MEIYVHQHNIEHIVNDKEFNEHLAKCLDLYAHNIVPEVEDFGGKFSSTVSLDYYEEMHYFQEIDNRKYIMNWLKTVVLSYCKDKNIKIKDLELKRAWCNRIHRGVKGKPHRHNGPETDKVVILYYEAPKGSSDFVIIDSDEQLDSYDLYDKERLHFLPVHAGMALMHDGEIMHAITEHQSDEPRTVFVFDIKINGKDEHIGA